MRVCIAGSERDGARAGCGRDGGGGGKKKTEEEKTKKKEEKGGDERDGGQRGTLKGKGRCAYRRKLVMTVRGKEGERWGGQE